MNSSMALNQVWVRILDNIASFSAFLTLSLVLIWVLLHWRLIGHRVLLIVAAAFCIVRATTNVLTAWDLYTGGTLLALWLHSISAAFGIAFAIHVLVSKDDLLVTLRTSEAEDRVRADRLADREQTRVNMEFLALQTREKSEQLVSESGRRDA